MTVRYAIFIWPVLAVLDFRSGSFARIDQRRLNGRSRGDCSQLWRQFDRQGVIAPTWDSQSGDRFLLG